MHMAMGTTHSSGAASSKALQLRITLDELLGEHALLAIQATQRGFAGGADFPALAKQLDANSVAISKAIGSVYGSAAANTFLNGKNLWRAHITDFVNYTIATAKKDPAGQKKAVNALMAYIQTQAAFFSKATGLPQKALVNDLTAHVLQLKGQLDAYAAGNYAQAYQLANGAYEHMFMTGDLLASAIAKQKHLGSTTSPSADLEITLDRLLGEHALLATWATQAGLGGGKNFPALAKQLDANSVAISKAIGSVYGSAAADTFLNGKNLWRAHITDFVNYTIATGQEGSGGAEEGGQRVDGVHPDTGGVLLEGDRAAEAGTRQRPDRARPPAQGRARRVRPEAVRQDVPARRRCVPAHVHDRSGPGRRHREAEGPALGPSL